MVARLSASQSNAAEQVRSWLRTWRPRGQKPFFYLAGFAGTGKTTIARELASSVSRASFASFTGKAAHVMRSKGCVGAKTIHSLIYSYEDDESGKPTFSLNEESEILDSDLVVIDECSMVGPEIGEDLLSFGRPVLVLGDPAQLPPVSGAGFFTSGEPDVLLTEVRRQDLESPILRLATDIREGAPLELSNDPRCRVARKSDVMRETWPDYDQVIVGTNALRRRLNSEIRGMLGRGDWVPKPSERVICLRNNRKTGLFNGQIWGVDRCEEQGKKLVLSVSEDGRGVVCPVHPEPFRGEKINERTRRSADEFDFAYAVTCHKSQGSEWDSVLVFDQSSIFRENSRRWLYTAVTRAAEKLTVVVRDL